MITPSTSEQAMSVDRVSLRALIRGVRGHFGESRHPRTAFVLSGGASLGALQVGMLRALYERGIAPDLLVGASAGALNDALAATRSFLATAAVAEPAFA
jgi:predicted acylesterase/phospholipase RssA